MAGHLMNACFVSGISSAFDTHDVAAGTMPNPQQYIPIKIQQPRIVLLGKTGVGKSASGNTILGQSVFRSIFGTIAVTSRCSENRTTVSGRSLSVIDTPGFFDTEMNSNEFITEVLKSVYLSSPGPHAFLIVFRVDERFTEQEQKIPQMIETLFGQEVLKYSMILFTRGDLLEIKPIEELIQENIHLKHLVKQCGGRYHVFNNKDINNREQVNELLQKIDAMIEQNGGGHYSNQMYEDAQRHRREEEEKMHRREKEERRQRREKEEWQQKRKEEQRRQKREEEQRRQKQEEEQRRQKREEEGRQREKEWNKQLERVIKETEERVRAEFEGQQEPNSGFPLFFCKYKDHIYMAAVAAGIVVGGTVGGAVVYGAVGGAIAGGAVSGGVVGAAVGGTKSGSVTGAVCGAVCGAAYGAASGAAVGAVVGGSTVGATLIGTVANAVGVGVVSGAAVGGAVGGASTGDFRGVANGALAGAIVGGTAVSGATVGAALSGSVGGASLCGAVAGGAVGGAGIGVAVSRSVYGALEGGVAVGTAVLTGTVVVCGKDVGGATVGVVGKAILEAVGGRAAVEVVKTSAAGIALVGLHCKTHQEHLKEK